MFRRTAGYLGRRHGRLPEVGSARIDWSKLAFDYVPTSGFSSFEYNNGCWSTNLKFTADPFVKVHVLGNVFHYGQAVFEGLKAFHNKDGTVKVFSDDLNYERLTYSCRKLQIPPPTLDMWVRGIDQAVRENLAYVPPYGSGGALYIRPLVIGSGPRLGLGPAQEFKFLVITNPVGSYYPAGKLKALDAVIPTEFDRCAPLGIGDAKAAANYAADLQSLTYAKERGFPICLYLDAKERKYVTEFNTSNFIAIRDNTYITPENSRAVLNSVTNRRLSELAEKMLGMKVERRPVIFESEVDSWNEVGAVGTAVVVTPIKSISYDNKVYRFEENPRKLQQLHDLVRAIQQGNEPDHFGWLRTVV